MKVVLACIALGTLSIFFVMTKKIEEPNKIVEKTFVEPKQKIISEKPKAFIKTEVKKPSEKNSFDQNQLAFEFEDAAIPELPSEIDEQIKNIEEQIAQKNFIEKINEQKLTTQEKDHFKKLLQRRNKLYAEKIKLVIEQDI